MAVFVSPSSEHGVGRAVKGYSQNPWVCLPASNWRVTLTSSLTSLSPRFLVLRWGGCHLFGVLGTKEGTARRRGQVFLARQKCCTNISIGAVPLLPGHWPILVVHPSSSSQGSARHFQLHFSDMETVFQGSTEFLKGRRWALSSEFCPPSSKTFLP